MSIKIKIDWVAIGLVLLLFAAIVTFDALVFSVYYLFTLLNP
jgi:hypothetical protein